MDVSSWTLAQRMRLPDWCFGNRDLLMLSLGVWTGGGFGWVIGAEALPQQICIWQMGVVIRRNESADNYFRLGMRATIPTTEAHMNDSTPLFPKWGNINYTPPRITLPAETDQVWFFNTRNGIDTGGLKFVGEIWGDDCAAMAQVNIVYSELPTSMAGWLAHHKV
ncbi:hypothetical protein ES703_87408 [subsurface metagenome]